MENQEFKCKVGDIVYDSVLLPGEALKVVSVGIFFIGIGHDNKRYYSYYKNGSYSNHSIPTLSHEPYEVNINRVTEKIKEF